MPSLKRAWLGKVNESCSLEQTLCEIYSSQRVNTLVFAQQWFATPGLHYMDGTSVEAKITRAFLLKKSKCFALVK